MTEDSEKTKEFVASKGLTVNEANELLLKYGRNELPEKKRPKVELPFHIAIFHLAYLIM